MQDENGDQDKKRAFVCRDCFGEMFEPFQKSMANTARA